MTTYYLVSPDGIFLRSSEQLLSVGRELPVGTYSVKQNPQTGEFRLVKVDTFVRPKKLYGNVADKANRILSTFNSRAVATGVLLSGEMGSGKTMLARELSIRAAEQGISTIIVGEDFSGPEFNEFIQRIDVPSLILFDEFEKMYDKDDQELMLTLLDGVFPSKKLFILTCNDMWKIDKHIINRPGRIFYHIQYKGLEHDFVSEYCADALVNKGHTEDVERLVSHFHTFNFDMLKALIEEMNRYDIDVSEAIEMLNMTPASGESEYYDVEVFYDGEKVEGGVHPNPYNGNPLSGQRLTISYYNHDDDDDDDSSSKRKPRRKNKLKNTTWKFNASNLVKIDGHVYTFEVDGATIIMTRQVREQFSFQRFNPLAY